MRVQFYTVRYWDTDSAFTVYLYYGYVKEVLGFTMCE